MRVLLLNLYYPPDTSATAKMAAVLVEALTAAHDVTVLCGRPSYEPTERRPWRPWQTECAGRVRIIRVGSTDYPRLKMKWRMLNYLSYAALSVVRGLFVRCDVILAMTDPPFEGILGAFVALLKRKPYLYNIRDLYPDMALGAGILKPGLLTRIWERMHRWAMRRAARVIVLGNDMGTRIIAKGVAEANVEVVRDGTEIAALNAPLPAIDSEVVRAIRGDFQFVFLHAGNLGFYGAWDSLIEAAKLLHEPDRGIGLVFVGEGVELDRLRSLSAGCTSISFLPFFPASKIPSVLAAGDVHVVTVKKGLEGVVVPSKVYGILAAAKPILAVAEMQSDIAKIVVEWRCGYAASSQFPRQVLEAMRAFAAGGPQSEGLRRMSEAARAAALHYDRVNELRKFLNIVNGFAAGEKIEGRKA